jgi:formate-dependent nitrite reductase cytochrome c552 subunit
MAEEGSSALEDVMERLQAQLNAALAAREQEEQELAVSQRQTESAVSQLRDAQLRMDHLQASHKPPLPSGHIPQALLRIFLPRRDHVTCYT